MARLRAPLALCLTTLLALGLAACTGVSGQRVEELKDDTGRVDVTAAEAEKLLTDPDQRGIVVLDIRTQPEFADGHIAGSYNVEVDAPSFGETLNGFSKAATYLVYGTDGDDLRAGAAADQMVQFGIGKVYCVTDGFAAWKGDKE
jgi:rhodanese-related sulfurtransferase